jgi:phage terminase large subunit-like protein
MAQKLNASKATAELCRRSLYKFVQEFWEIIIPEDPVWNWHIKHICDELQSDVLRVCKLPATKMLFEGEYIEIAAKNRQPKLHDDLINVPPGSSKSTIITIMLPAWAWTIDPTLRIVSASYSGDLSQDHAVKSRDIIMSDKYKEYFPEIELRSDQNNKNNYKNTKNGERYATSVGGTIMGIHAHIIIVDDPLNPKQSASEIQLAEACNFVDTTLSTRKVDKAVTLTILVMQRLNELDPSGVWLRKRDREGKKVRHICLPARITDRVFPESLRDNYIEGLLDPIRMNDEVLRDMEIDLGSYGFAGQLLQDPAPEGGGIWQQWLIPVPDKDMPSREEMTGYGTGWDTAYTDSKTNAASAYVTSGMFNHKMYIDGIGWFHKEFPDLINTMKLLPEPHYIEAKASGKSAVQTLVVAGIAAIEVEVPGDKIVRARSATPKAEAGMVFCRASLLNKIYNDADQGILKFPNGAKKDLADALSQEILRHLGKPVRNILVGWNRPKKSA